MAKAGSTNFRCNDQIRITPVRLIGPDNEQVGIIETPEAQRMAREAGLDLVEVAGRERPPVCRIMDYGKFKYNQKKNVKKHHEQQLKEVRFRPKIDDNDRSIKINRALKFLSNGDKVQFTMQFRGRERARRQVGVVKLNEIHAQIAPLVKLERPPSMDGRHMIMIVAPNKSEFTKLAEKGVKLNLQNVRAEFGIADGEPVAPAQPSVPAAASQTAPDSVAARASGEASDA